YMYTMLGPAAIEHLFRVSTGLDSMLLGEAEILGQVKDAYIQAQQAGSLGKTLHHLFREALNAGKGARSQTRIGDESVSIATAAIELAKLRLGELRDKTVVVIGAGKMGRSAAKRLQGEGARRLIITNRSLGRAQDVVAEVGFGEALELPSLAEALEKADMVITSTGASHFVLTKENLAEALARRPGHPLFVVDIAVPRDVDPEVREIAGVTLVDIDGLQSVVDQKLETRREAIPHVEEIITEYVARFERWYESRVAVPVIASLHQKAETIRAAELGRLFARCPELTERERMLITGMSLTIISKLLHNLVTNIRDKAANNDAETLTRVRVLDELFDLSLDAEE
ncbi:MAG: glutamyl-tRNA reductase, partial [Candidatus Eremiobacteraeota bacterium]|nr:glutamyl-tRNA reductase [Candidatus Eremiobacteraeota bacterium]